MPTLPNVILVHGHDLGRWLSCHGMPSVPSPNLQALADESIVFDNAFATAPLCTPARSSLFSGLLPHQNGLMGLTHNGWRYRDEVRTLPQVLAGCGYRTALVGLQHEDLDARALGFEEVHGLGFLPRALEVARRTAWWFEQKQDDRPFFLTVGTWEVHRPWPAEDYEPVAPGSVEIPPYLPDNASTRRDVGEFYGAVRQLDEAVGMVLEALDRSPAADNTLVLFTTDHGAAFPRAKSTLYDPGVEVAFIVRPPREWDVRPGRRQEIVSHLDVLPTLVDLAGGVPDPGLEGRSILPALRGGGGLAEDRDLVLEKTYHDRYDPIRALRTRDAKYIRNYEAGPRLPLPIDLEESWTRQGMGDDHLEPRPAEELYLLDRDPWELTNVADDPAYRDLKRQLAERLSFHMRRTGDPLVDGLVDAPPVPVREVAEPERTIG